MFRNNFGFTLLEMLIVLSIISLLVLLIAPNLGKSNKNIQETGCQALKSLVQSQVQLYHLENEEYPRSLQDLVEGGYLEEHQLTCPNDQEIDYEPSTGQVNIDG